MVYFLHSSSDTANASRDVARLYATRTLLATGSVNKLTLRSILIDVLAKDTRVVVAHDFSPKGEWLSVLLNILDELDWKVSTVDQYLQELHPVAPQAAPQLPSAVAAG